MPQKILAIIPARSGSKGIPGKNLVDIARRPLIYWTIQSAQESNFITRLMVNTDSEDIAHIAIQYGAEVPFIRPVNLAQDNTPTIPVLQYSLRWLAEQEKYIPDYIICLQATSPFRTSQDIDQAFRVALNNDADCVVSLVEEKHNPEWLIKIDSQGRVNKYLPTDKPVLRRQDLPNFYALNGAIYIAKPHILHQKATWYTKRTFAYVMSEENSLDIDTLWDLYIARLIFKDRKK